jgi:glutaredoxin 2
MSSGTNYSQYLGQTAALVRNLNNYMDNLPKTVAADAGVKQAASQVDQTLASYLKSLTSASGSSSKFADDIFKAGVNVKTITNSLLKQSKSSEPL